MGDFLEALVTLLPAEAGGLQLPIAPRDGSYRPFLASSPERIRIRFIEGPPSIAPGQAGRVVVELESPLTENSPLTPGAELDLLEEDRVVGIFTVARVWRSAIAV
jgi:hypothetical protein